MRKGKSIFADADLPDFKVVVNSWDDNVEEP